MPSVKFNQLFGKSIPTEYGLAFEQCEILSCDISDDRRLKLDAKSSTYISLKTVNAVKSAICEAFTLKSAEFSLTFAPDTFGVEACADITEIIKQKNVLLNGYFKEAEYELSDDKLNIVLKYGGYNTIVDVEFVSKFNAICFSMFGRSVDVAFSGQLENIEMEMPKVEAPVMRQKQEA